MKSAVGEYSDTVNHTMYEKEHRLKMSNSFDKLGASAGQGQRIL